MHFAHVLLLTEHISKVTFYESYHLQGTPHFAITPLPVAIDNTDKEGDCDGNALQDQPQASSAPSRSPWLNEDGSIVTFPSNDALSLGRSITGTLTFLIVCFLALIIV
jgi:hypothetical protein